MVTDRTARAALMMSALVALGGTATFGHSAALTGANEPSEVHGPTDSLARVEVQDPTDAHAHGTTEFQDPTDAHAHATTQAPAPTDTDSPTSPDAPPPVESQVAVPVVGTSTLVGQAAPGTTELDGAIVRVRGTELLTLEETTDPRTTGRAIITVNFDAFPDAAGLPGATQVRFGQIRIENADGAWQGHFTGSLANAGFIQLYWLEGEGDYEGLSYVITAGGNGNVWQSSGLIFPGDIPPQGTAPTLPIDAIGGDRPSAWAPPS